MQTPTTSVRIPFELRDDFTSIRERLGLRQTEAILQALELWVNINKQEN
ncbi:hypothetical protein [Nostoc sp. CENA543]|nr:hypothetical protein [Nostoc sp. CENA543]